MKSSNQDARALWAGVGALLIVGLFLGLRAQQAMTAVLSADSQTELEPDGTTQLWLASAARVREQDSLLTKSVPGARDPFDEPRYQSPAQPAQPDQPQPQRSRRAPAIAALLYDRVNPSVQLRTSEATSGWLHVGDRFAGWTVLEISEESVKVSQGSEQIVVKLSSF